MKATAQTIPLVLPAEKGWVPVYADLLKARLTLLVLVAKLVGFYAGLRGPMDWSLLIQALLGTGMVASGAAALNQIWERDFDARMRRTADRPLPAGHLQPFTVLVFGTTCAFVGLVWLALAVNPLTSVIGAATLVSYLFIYTPLKRVTWLNTLVGAIPGGLPPLMGWTAAHGAASVEGWALFAILAFWQIPHFMAIAWMYRDEYARAGFVMLPVVDRDGPTHGPSGGRALAGAAGSKPVSVLPRAHWRDLPDRGAGAGNPLHRLRGAIRAATHDAAGAAVVLRLDSLPATVARPAGAGQEMNSEVRNPKSEVNWKADAQRGRCLRRFAFGFLLDFGLRF